MKDQRKKIRELFEHRPNEWIPIYEFVNIALQYNARVFELKKEGMLIMNKKEKINGIWHSWLRYTPKDIHSQEERAEFAKIIPQAVLDTDMQELWQKQRLVDEKEKEASLFNG
jgi:hypothetical protein